MPKAAVVESAPPSAVVVLVEDYLASKRAAGVSSKTTTHYRSVLTTILLPFCAAEGITEPEQLTQKSLDRLGTKLLDEGGPRGTLTKHSVSTYLSTINYLLAWARKAGELQSAAKAQTPKLPRRLLEVLERGEIQQLEDAATTERDKLIIRVLADTGMRASELLGLRTGDLVERGGKAYLRVIGKGDKQREVPLPPGLQRRLRKFITRGRPKDAVTDRIFLGLRRRPQSSDYEPLKLTGLEQMLRTLGHDVLGKRTYPHLLRHSFVTWTLQRGMNPLQVQRIVGHEGLEMINRVYTHLTADDAHDALMAALRAEN
jgi:integrase/recombinase XerD